MLVGMDERLCLLTVHAHPDDEASKGAGTVARYDAEAVRCVLVTCTGGEAGDILNPAMDRPGVREMLPQIRREELKHAAAIIGYEDVVRLDYKDSGMPDTPHNDDPGCFAQADFREAVGRLVTVIRRERPQVIVTYSDDQRGYPHPDHLRVHDVSVHAFDVADDPEAFPWAGPPWRPLKLYYTTWSKARLSAMHEKFTELGLESPYDERWFERPWQDDRITTKIDCAGYQHVRRDALRAHATQVDPTSTFWFGLPDEVADTVYPYDEYILARSHVRVPEAEDDLFAGIREPARERV